MAERIALQVTTVTTTRTMTKYYLLYSEAGVLVTARHTTQIEVTIEALLGGLRIVQVSKDEYEAALFALC